MEGSVSEAFIEVEFEETRCFVDGVQVSGPPAPPSPPPKKLEPCCEAPHRMFSCIHYFGPDCNTWACANCKRSGKVYEIDGTPRDQWPPEPGPARQVP